MNEEKINNLKNNINNLILEKYNICFSNMGNKYYEIKKGNVGWYNMKLLKSNGNVLCEIDFELFKEIKSFIEGLEVEGVKIDFDKKKWGGNKEEYNEFILGGSSLCRYFGIDKFEGSYEDYLKFLYEHKRNIWGGFILKIII